MGELYIASYQAATPAYLKRVRWSPEDEIGFAYADAVRRSDWPYDAGDDPSFFSMRFTGGALTWGICRPDLRNKLKPGDTVIFFAFKFRPGGLDYYFCGYNTVSRLVRQSDVWEHDGLSCYRQYLNLLISRQGTSYQWHEPHRVGAPKSALHRDWLWRIAKREGFCRKDFDAVDGLDLFEPQRTCLGQGRRRLKLAPNYVLFGRERPDNFTLETPYLVARYEGSPAAMETWRDNDERAEAIRSMTVCLSDRGHLRTRNRQRPNRHIRLKANAREWRAEAYSALMNMGFPPIEA